MIALQELATQMKVSEKDLMSTISSLGDIINRRFVENNIPLTPENVAQAIPMAFTILIECGERARNDLEGTCQQVFEILKTERSMR